MTSAPPRIDDGKHHGHPPGSMRATLNEIIFGYETPAGRLFDVVLMILILLSVSAVLLDSVGSLHQRYLAAFHALEWGFTLLFTAEYALRLYSSAAPRRYALSFYGLVDLCSILPTYLAFLWPQSSFLIVIRILRILRIFRVLKLIRYMGEANVLSRALWESRRKVLVFIFSVLTLQVVFGSIMYIVEGPANGFTSIPASIYWAIVTMTTVGFGDIVPRTDLGRLIASVAMLSGYAIIAVPTGIVSSELMNQSQSRQRQDTHDFGIVCPHCKRKGHDRDANYCKQCGQAL
ncbi:MAG: ion transporter [Pseudohongiellaceae bacterium]